MLISLFLLLVNVILVVHSDKCKDEEYYDEREMMCFKKLKETDQCTRDDHCESNNCVMRVSSNRSIKECKGGYEKDRESRDRDRDRDRDDRDRNRTQRDRDRDRDRDWDRKDWERDYNSNDRDLSEKDKKFARYIAKETALEFMRLRKKYDRDGKIDLDDLKSR